MSERHTGFYASPKYLEFTSWKIWLCEAECVGKGDFVATSSAGKWEKKKKKGAGACKWDRAGVGKQAMAELQQLWFLCVSVPELVILTQTMTLNATSHSAPTSLLCFVMLQVVETNLVAFDCHWILINEVSVTEMIHASRCVFVCLYFDLARHTGPELSVLWSRMQCSKVFCSSSPLVSFLPQQHTNWWLRTCCLTSVRKVCCAPLTKTKKITLSALPQSIFNATF